MEYEFLVDGKKIESKPIVILQPTHSLIESLLQTVIVMIMSIMFLQSITVEKTTDVVEVKHESTVYLPFTIQKEWRETKSVFWKNQTNAHKLKQVLQRLLKRESFPILCMHHVAEMDYPYRACAVANRDAKQTYFILNPKIIGHSQQFQMMQESSIACRKPYQRQRYEVIHLKWETLHHGVMYAQFEGEQAVAIQMALDEFLGTVHCDFPAKVNPMTTNEYMVATP